MKTLFITVLSLISLTTVAQAQTTATSADEVAIKKVITDQTNAFFAKNRDKWASYWVHEPYINWTAQGGADRIMSVSGWEAYSGMFEGYFNDPTPGPATTILHENFQVTVLDKVATATYLQTRQRADGNLRKPRSTDIRKAGSRLEISIRLQPQ